MEEFCAKCNKEFCGGYSTAVWECYELTRGEIPYGFEIEKDNIVVKLIENGQKQENPLSIKDRVVLMKGGLDPLPTTRGYRDKHDTLWVNLEGELKKIEVAHVEKKKINFHELPLGVIHEVKKISRSTVNAYAYGHRSFTVRNTYDELWLVVY